MIDVKINGKMSKKNIAIPKDFKEQLEEHIMEELDSYMLQVVVADAKHNTQNITGNLQDSWQSTPARKTKEGIEAALVNNMEYALHYEYGHRQEVGKYIPALGKRLVKPYVKGRYTGTNAIDRGKRGIAGVVNEAFNKVFGG